MNQIHLWKPKKKHACARLYSACQSWMTLSQTLSLFLSKCTFTCFKNKHYFARLDSAQSCVYLWWCWDFSVLPCVAGCCSVLQCVAVNSEFLYVWWSEDFWKARAAHCTHCTAHFILVHYVAICCSVLQCIVLCCSVMQLGCVWSSVHMWCGVFQCAGQRVKHTHIHTR